MNGKNDSLYIFILNKFYKKAINFELNNSFKKNKSNPNGYASKKDYFNSFIFSDEMKELIQELESDKKNKELLEKLDNMINIVVSENVGDVLIMRKDKTKKSSGKNKKTKKQKK